MELALLGQGASWSKPTWSQAVTGRGSVDMNPSIPRSSFLITVRMEKYQQSKHSFIFLWQNGLPFSDHMLIRILLVVSNRAQFTGLNMKMWKRLWRTHQHQGVNSSSPCYWETQGRSAIKQAVSKRSTTSPRLSPFSAFFWNEVIFRPTLPRIRYDGCLQFLTYLQQEERTTSDRSQPKSQSLLLLANTTELITKDKKRNIGQT